MFRLQRLGFALMFAPTIGIAEVPPPPPTGDSWSVVFAKDSDAITPDQTTFLKQLASGARSSNISCAHLIGHSAAQEGSLSERRAEAVKSVLVAVGFDPAIGQTVEGKFC